MSAKHTPTPWKVTGEIREDNEGISIESADGITFICSMSGGLPRYEVEANAAFIIQAVNSYKKLKRDNEVLLKAARITEHFLDKLRAGKLTATEIRIELADEELDSVLALRRAIAQAEGK